MENKKSTKPNFPSAFSLVNSPHLPPIANQGLSNSCIAESITAQLSNAMNKYTQEQQPSKPKSSQCFSTKFVYDFSDTGPGGVYEFIQDHGCLPTNSWAFERNINGVWRFFDDNKVLIKKSAAWAVEKDLMKQALKSRIKNHEIFIHKKSPFCKAKNSDTTDNPWYLSSQENSFTTAEMINKIKATLLAGNSVLSKAHGCNNKRHHLQRDCGKYGKKDDFAIVFAEKTRPINHASVIVGYDDNIEIDFAGHTLRGAFLVAFSYGEKVYNKGYLWAMYDSLNETSNHEALNNQNLLYDHLYISPTNSEMVLNTTAIAKQTNINQNFIFTKTETQTSFCGENYDNYTIFCKQNNKYISFSQDCEDFKIYYSDKAHENCLWSLVPYEKHAKSSAFELDYEPKFEGSYWIFANHQSTDPSNKKVLCAFPEFGKRVCLVRYNRGKNTVGKSWSLDIELNNRAFESRLQVGKSENLTKRQREIAFEQFGFIYWDEDIIANKLPCLISEIELDVVDREGFSITLIRMDKQGKIDKWLPAMFANKHARYARMAQDFLTFSGELNSTIPETGHFALQYGDLLDIPQGESIKDYSWGVEISANGKFPVSVRKISLTDSSENTLATMDFNEKTEKLENTSKIYIFEK